MKLIMAPAEPTHFYIEREMTQRARDDDALMRDLQDDAVAADEGDWR
jgi:hypothetical protein